jgi:transposase
VAGCGRTGPGTRCIFRRAPAATQWEVVEEAAELLKPARDELIRQAAQGEVVHNGDTSMRVLRLARERSDERTGVFTSGIVSTGQGGQGWKVALYFTGRQHAGENLADVLQQRAKHASPPIQMCQRSHLPPPQHQPSKATA